MAEDSETVVQAKPRAHLSDLFRAGKQLTITDSNDVEYVLWMQRPTATQQEDAREAANVKSLRLKMQYKERDGDRYLVLHQTMEEMDDHDELVETRAKYKDGDIRNQAFNDSDIQYKIDFEKCEVIAIFQGAGWNSRGIRLEEVKETANNISIRYDNISYQTSGVGGGGVRVAVFAFLVFPKTSKSFQLQENTQGLKGRPAKWTERALLKVR